MKILKSIKYKLTTFGEPSKEHGKSLSEESIKELLSNPDFLEYQGNGYLFGFLSHLPRKKLSSEWEETKLPYADLAMNSGDVATVLNDLKIVQDPADSSKRILVGTLNVLDTDKGRQFLALLQSSGAKVSLHALHNPGKSTKEFWITWINGADVTTSPAFDTEVIDSLFSRTCPVSALSGRYFPMQELALEASFSTKPPQAGSELEDDVEFSLTHLDRTLAESRKKTSEIIYSRYRILRRWIPNHTDDIAEYYNQLLEYILYHIRSWVTKFIYSEEKTRNMILSLGLQRILRTREYKVPAEELNRFLIKLKSAMGPSKIIRRDLQPQLQLHFKKLGIALMGQLATDTNSSVLRDLVTKELEIVEGESNGNN